MTNRPKNPYREGSLTYAIMEGALEGEFDGKAGWEDMTAKQIGEVFGVRRRDTITSIISQIRRETGYEIKYVRLDSHGRKYKEVET